MAKKVKEFDLKTGEKFYLKINKILRLINGSILLCGHSRPKVRTAERWLTELASACTAEVAYLDELASLVEEVDSGLQN